MMNRQDKNVVILSGLVMDVAIPEDDTEKEFLDIILRSEMHGDGRCILKNYRVQVPVRKFKMNFTKGNILCVTGYLNQDKSGIFISVESISEL